MSDSNERGAGDERAPTTDPEILKLLDFEPVPRRHKRGDGWTPALQRIFIAELARWGSVNAATEALGKNRYGVEKLYKAAGAASFRAAWDAAIALFEERAAERIARDHAPLAGVKPPFVDRRRKAEMPAGPLPGQVLNERGEWEDDSSLKQRAEEAKDSISDKLLRCRRMYLAEISGSAGKRAAFEILTGFPIDWERAARLQPQDDEPWRKPRMRDPDMMLTAENGWFGGLAHGEDKMAELRAAVDEERARQGKPPADWGESAESKTNDGGGGLTPPEQQPSSQDNAGRG